MILRKFYSDGLHELSFVDFSKAQIDVIVNSK